MSDKGIKTTDEVALIKGMSKHLPKEQTDMRVVYEIGTAYILYKAISNVLRRP